MLQPIYSFIVFMLFRRFAIPLFILQTYYLCSVCFFVVFSPKFKRVIVNNLTRIYKIGSGRFEIHI